MGSYKFLTVILFLFPLLQFSYFTKLQNGEYQVKEYCFNKELPRVKSSVDHHTCFILGMLVFITRCQKLVHKSVRVTFPF
jgi:hypothetical protein